jgi:chemotaxis protein methyltransferase CheR
MSFDYPKTEQLSAAKLTASHFLRVRDMLHNYCGIFLSEGKEALVKARLLKRLRHHGMNDFDSYLAYVETESSGSEFLSLVDVLTTNKTSFFRESQHFDYLRANVIADMQNRDVTWWSAGCSSGEEPYTLAMLLNEDRPRGARGKVRILATDISQNVLQKAKRGVYTAENVHDIPGPLLQKYFVRQPGSPATWQVTSDLSNLITFGRLNLQEPWPMKGPFQVIFCRNVMIYFNRATQQELINRFYDLLEPGGYLFLGHSESISGFNHKYRTIIPAAYQKK